MKYYPKRYLIVGIMAIMLMVTTISAVVAQSTETVYITSPSNGETIKGVVTISGAADFPNFLKYEVFLKTGDQMYWVATGFAPVIDGNLSHMDTRIFLDGTYQLIIRKVGNDSNYTDFVGSTVTIANELGAPLPQTEVETNILYPPQSGHAVARIRNCTGADMEFDYVGDTGGCSAGNLWVMPKLQDAPICTYEDVFMRPCLYRGTSVTTADEVGATYQHQINAEKVYIFEYVGGGRLFISESDGDDRTTSDVGGLMADDPLRLAASGPEAVEAAMSMTMENSAETSNSTAAMAAPVPEAEQATEAETAVLPESGQAANETNPYFVISGAALLLLMIMGGLFAMRHGKQAL